MDSVVDYGSKPTGKAATSPRREESRSRSRSPLLNISLVPNKKMPQRSPSKEASTDSRADDNRRGPSKESLEAAHRASHLRRDRTPPRRYPPRPPPGYRYEQRLSHNGYYYDYGAQQHHQYADVYEPATYGQNWGTDYRRPPAYQRATKSKK
jgi:hypothetical protein